MMMVIVMTKKTVVVVVTTMLPTGMLLLMFTYIFGRVVPLLNATVDDYRNLRTYLCTSNFVGYGILAGSR